VPLSERYLHKFPAKNKYAENFGIFLKEVCERKGAKTGLSRISSNEIA
jgi:hypothetical protein